MKPTKFVLAAVTALAVAGSAFAAAPAKNGLYIGTLTGRGLEKRIELHVSKSGKRATAALYCANTLSGKLSSFRIKHGRFNAVKRTGHLVVFRLKGRFTSKTSVSVGLLPRAVCDGVGGSFTLQLSSS